MNAEIEFVDRVRQRLAASSSASSDLGLVVRAEQSNASVIADDASLAALERDVAAELSGAGPLEPLLGLAGITDVLVNAPSEVWLDRGRGLERADVAFADDMAVRRLAQRLAAVAGRRLDDGSPFVDAAMPDGTRLHAVLPPITPHTTLSLRVLARRRFELRDLVEYRVAAVLRAIVAARLTLVISGSTGTGKDDTARCAARLRVARRAPRGHRGCRRTGHLPPARRASGHSHGERRGVRRDRPA